MSSPNTAITAIISVGAIAFLGLAGYGINQTVQASDNAAKCNSTLKIIQSAANSEFPPTQATLTKLKDNYAHYEDVVKELKATHAQFIPTAEDVAEIPAEQFPLTLKKDLQEFQKKAADKNVKLDKEFLLGFNEYFSKAPLLQATGLLNYELGAINWLLDTALDSNVTSIIRVYREKTSLEVQDEAVTAKTVKTKRTTAKSAKESSKSLQGLFAKGEEYKNLPISLTLKGKRGTVVELCNKITQSKKYLFTIQALRCNNDKPGALNIAPTTTATKTAKHQGGDLFKSGSTKDDAPKAEKILKPVVGDEEVTYHLVLNLVLFAPESAPSTKSAPSSK